MRIAVPSMRPGGLEAEMTAHFGHCEVFTIITLEGKEVAEVSVISNGHHGAGSCGAPVAQLTEAGVKALLVGGMGMRPLEMLRAQGIGVFLTRAAIVGDALKDYLEGRLAGFEPASACGGGQAPGACPGPGHK